MNGPWARVFLLALLLCGAAHAEVAVPPLAHRITDLTGTLDARQVQELEDRLAAFERDKGAQLAVLIVPTTEPETVEQYGIRVADKWKLGRKGVDDGALLLIAREDRTLRIEAGYGLEGALNDATANRIIAEIIVPQLKRGDYYGGIEAGLSAMMKVIGGEPLPPPSRRTAASGSYDIETMLVIAFALAVVGGGILRALVGRFPAALMMGGALGVLAWVMVSSILIAAFVGLIAFVFVLLGGMGIGGYGGGYGSGGFGGGGGGFGGGGGGFGGGGASGRW